MLIPGHRTPPTTATAHSFLISEASTLALVKPRLAADSGPVRFYPIRTPLSSLLRSLPRSGPARAARAHVRTYAAVRAAQESARKLGIGRRSRPAGGCHVRAVALRSSFPMRRSVGFGFLVPFWCDIPAKRTAPSGCSADTSGQLDGHPRQLIYTPPACPGPHERDRSRPVVGTCQERCRTRPGAARGCQRRRAGTTSARSRMLALLSILDLSSVQSGRK
jgi:hypothetical protein